MVTQNSLVWAGRKNKLYISAFCLLVSALIIGICSRSSPLYPFNNCDDNNCFFTMGKAIANGKVMYRDIYEQKGPLLYFIYVPIYMISNKSFLGSYFFETVFFAVFLYLVFKLMLGSFKLNAISAAICIPLMSALLCTCRSFSLGGTVEQFTIAAIFLPVYTAINSYSNGRYIPSNKMIVCLGAGAAILLWVKYTTLGIYLGYIVFAMSYCLYKKEYRKLLISAALFLLGMSLVSLPILIYFCANDALKELFEAYFYNNIFLYGGKDGKGLLLFLRHICGGLLTNPSISVPMGLWLIYIILSHENIFFKICMLCLYVAQVVFIYIGGVSYAYYAFAMAPLAVPGYCLIAKCLQNRLSGHSDFALGRHRYLICSASVLISAVLAYVLSSNTFFMNYGDEELWYVQFDSAIEESEDRSLFNYNFIDTGLYTITGYLPENKFFCRFNIPLKEMEDEAERIIKQKQVEWIVTCRNDDELLNNNYNLELAFENFMYIKNRYLDYYLYRRK